MSTLASIDVIAIDVLGTLVDEPAAVRAALRTARPGVTERELAEAAVIWDALLVDEQQRMRRDERPHIDADALNAEAAAVLATRLGWEDATSATLTTLAARAGFGWDGALSASDAGVYKPDPSAYALVEDATGVPPQRTLMVAAHAWDLRAAQEVGMRTAYVRRPVGDPPHPGDAFDGEFSTLAELPDALTD